MFSDGMTVRQSEVVEAVESFVGEMRGRGVRVRYTKEDRDESPGNTSERSRRVVVLKLEIERYP
jgi:hypothetical protein